MDIKRKIMPLCLLAAMTLFIVVAAGINVEYGKAPEFDRTVKILDCGSGLYHVNVGSNTAYLDANSPDNGRDETMILLQAISIFEQDHPDLVVVGWGPMFFGSRVDFYEGGGSGANVYNWYIQTVPKNSSRSIYASHWN